MTPVEWLVKQLRQLAHNPKTHLGMGDVRVTQGLIDEFEEQAKQMEAEQSKIPELSDEEIIKEAYGKIYNPDDINMFTFVEGAKFYREKLKQRL